MGCDCETVCPDAQHCAVMQILEPFPGEDACVAFCDGDDEKPGDEPRRRRLDAAIHVETKNVPLAKLGEFLASFCEEDVLIPARSASETVDLKQKDTTLGAVLESVGLVVAPAQAAG